MIIKRPTLGRRGKRYVAHAVSPDGQERAFDVRARNEESARRGLELFLRQHWKTWHVAELKPALQDEGEPKRRRKHTRATRKKIAESMRRYHERRRRATS